MADTRITDLTALTGANTAAGDVFVVVDVSDTTMAASGTDKKITKTELLTVFEAAGAAAAAQAASQPLDADLTAVAALSPTNDDVLQRKAGAWTNRTIAQLLTDLGLGALYQPLDSDLTAIAALTTTSYGRALLALADQAALTALIGASSATASGIVELATSAETITGTDTVRAVTPAGAAAAYQPLDSDLTSIAALTTTSYGRAFLALANQAATMALLSAASDTASGIVELATTAETTTGTDTTRAVTAAGVKAVADLKLSLVAAGAAVENIGAVEWNVNTVAATGATETLDVSLYGTHDCTMDQNCTFTFSNPAPSGKESEFKLILRGAFTPTLPASVDWGDASAPTYTTPSVYIFSTVDAGTTWIGSQVAKAIG